MTGDKAFLIRWLVHLKYKENGLIVEHLNGVQSIINQLSSMKMTLDDELQALLLLSSYQIAGKLSCFTKQFGSQRCCHYELSNRESAK